MGGIKGQIEEERVLLVPLHEGDGIVHAQVIIVYAVLAIGILGNVDE